MTDPFGAEPVVFVRDPRPRPGTLDTELVRDRLAALAGGAGAMLDVAVPAPTAAFSRRDTLLTGYDRAAVTVTDHGFAPMIRPVGGHLAAYDGGSLVLHLTAPHPDPRSQIRERFALFAGAVTEAFRGLGADARVGPVPGEYCDGEFSVNHAGRGKLVGTGQRIVRGGFLFSAVVMVHSAAPARAVLTAAYRELALDLRPETVGCLDDAVPGITSDDVVHQLVGALARLMVLEQPPAAALGVA